MFVADRPVFALFVAFFAFIAFALAAASRSVCRERAVELVRGQARTCATTSSRSATTSVRSTSTWRCRTPIRRPKQDYGQAGRGLRSREQRVLPHLRVDARAEGRRRGARGGPHACDLRPRSASPAASRPSAGRHASSTCATARPSRDVGVGAGGRERPRLVPACEADAQRVDRGEDPQARELSRSAGARCPYWEAGPAYAPYYGGYHSGYGGSALGLLLGSMLGGGWDDPTPSAGGGGRLERLRRRRLRRGRAVGISVAATSEAAVTLVAEDFEERFGPGRAGLWLAWLLVVALLGGSRRPRAPQGTGARLSAAKAEAALGPGVRRPRRGTRRPGPDVDALREPDPGHRRRADLRRGAARERDGGAARGGR